MTMKIDYNPLDGTLKVRPSIRTIVAIGVSLAGIRIVYDATQAAYIVALRKVQPKLESAVEEAVDRAEQLKNQIDD